MKRINQTTGQPYVSGYLDPNTGRVFRCYDKTRMRKDGTFFEIWYTPELYAAIKEKMRLRARARYAAQREAVKSIPSHLL